MGRTAGQKVIRCAFDGKAQLLAVPCHASLRASGLGKGFGFQGVQGLGF